MSRERVRSLNNCHLDGPEADGYSYRRRSNRATSKATVDVGLPLPRERH